jgi:3-deoxy-manno-octulosonate cytidylyltransferase (CMP-KDO synthetase)
MKIIGVIPARYKSSRFEGKPLADIHGKPMIWWVYKQACKVKAFEEVIVATDDDLIMENCIGLGINVMMTSSKHISGTDRVAEVSKVINADIVVNIQGDEPMIEPENIEIAIQPLLNQSELLVTNLMTKIENPLELISTTIPKVVTNKDGIGIYLSRSPIPHPKGDLGAIYYKQVCVYAFRPEALSYFSETPRGILEKIEDIDLLRFIENGIDIQFIEVKSRSIAVDTKLDLERVRIEIKKTI